MKNEKLTFALLVCSEIGTFLLTKSGDLSCFLPPQFASSKRRYSQVRKVKEEPNAERGIRYQSSSSQGRVYRQA